MRVDVITLFPEMVSGPLGQSMMRLAQDRELLQLQVLDLREFGMGRHRQVDDEPYGGGPGMVLRPEPIGAALDTVKKDGARVILLSPQGKRFSQEDAARLSNEEHLIFLCGNYEGFDQRVVENCVDEELSLGDYVLTNGAIAAVVVIDAVIRLVPGVLGDAESAVQESFSQDSRGAEGDQQFAKAPQVLDHPHYTRPVQWRGLKVPDILLSGNHKKVAEWRAQQAALRTRTQRPDLVGGGEGPPDVT